MLRAIGTVGLTAATMAGGLRAPHDGPSAPTAPCDDLWFRTEHIASHDTMSVNVARLDGDERPDLAYLNVCDSCDGRAYLYGGLQRADGTFAFRQFGEWARATTLASVLTGDLDADGDTDLAIVTDGRVLVNLNDGEANFTHTGSPAVSDDPWSGVIDDFDRDGDLDVATGDVRNGDVSVLLNDGDATFAPSVTYPVVGRAFGIAAGDFDGTLGPDLAVIDDDGVSILLNEGDGTFAPRAGYATVEPSLGLVAGDLEGDGHLDLAAGHGADGDVSVLLNRGDGTFAPPVRERSSGNNGLLAAADLDGDGDLDLAVAGYEEIEMLLNDGTASFSRGGRFRAGTWNLSLVAADLDLDGDPDLVESDSDNAHDAGVWLLYNTCCRADVDGSGVVDLDDVLLVLAAWGTSDPDADVDGNRTVDFDDLLAVLDGWGPCP